MKGLLATTVLLSFASFAHAQRGGTGWVIEGYNNQTEMTFNWDSAPDSVNGNQAFTVRVKATDFDTEVDYNPSTDEHRSTLFPNHDYYVTTTANTIGGSHTWTTYSSSATEGWVVFEAGIVAKNDVTVGDTVFRALTVTLTDSIPAYATTDAPVTITKQIALTGVAE